MNLIATVDKNWAIGKSNKLLVSIPKDRELLREETLGKVIVMGRKTFDIIFNGAALYGRENIVLSKDKNFQPKGVKVFRDFSSCLTYLKTLNQEDIYIIGGESIYRQFLPHIRFAHITYVDYQYEADAFLTDLDADRHWHMRLETEEETYFNLSYYFRMYENTTNSQ